MPTITDKSKPLFYRFHRPGSKGYSEGHGRREYRRLSRFAGCRTLSWTTDAFCPWRSFIVIPARGTCHGFLPFLLMPAGLPMSLGSMRSMSWDTFRWAEWIRSRSYRPISKTPFPGGTGRVGFEDGMSNYTPEGNLTRRRVYQGFCDALEGCELVNAQYIVDRLAD